MENSTKKKYKIAVIEDDPSLSRLFVAELENAGFGAVTAFDGEEGLKLVITEKPDLVLLDILMPKKNGLYVLEEMKKNSACKLIPVIVLSSLSEDLEIRQALSLGAEDYFVKSQQPIKEVVEKIREYLFGEKSANPPKVGT